MYLQYLFGGLKKGENKMRTIIILCLLCASFIAKAQGINDIIKQTKEQLNEEQDLAKKTVLLGDLSWYYLNLDLDSSEHYGFQALEIAKRIDDKKMIAQAYNDISNIYHVKGDYKVSLEFCSKSLVLRKELNDKDGVASVYYKMGNNYNKISTFDSAMFYYLKALEHYEEIDNLALINNVKSNISSTYLVMGNYPKALEYIYAPIEYFSKEENFTYLSNSTLNLGNIHLQLKDTASAMTAFKNAEKIAIKANNISTLAAIYNNISNIYMGQNKFDSAIVNIKKSIKIREDLGQLTELESSKLTLAISEFNTGDYIAAKPKLINLKNAFEESNSPDKLKQVYLLLSYVYATEANSDSLNYYSNKYNDILASIYHEETLKGTQELEVKYETEKKEKEILLGRAKLAEKNVFLVVIAAALLLTFLLAYFIIYRHKQKNKQLVKENELKDALLKIETQNKLQEQRLRISRDLHDNIGAQLTFIISSIDNMKMTFAKDDEILSNKLNKVSLFTKETIYELRDTIWAMNKEEITIEDLKTRISNFIDNAQLSQNGVVFNFNFQGNENAYVFESRTGMNLYRIIQEAVNNAIKHANASKIEVQFKESDKHFEIEVFDNGIGLDTKTTEAGNGLNSMEKRALELNGEFKIINLEQGTKISVKISK